MDSVSGVGVLDKAFGVLNVLVDGPMSLSEVVEATTIPRATCHRLLVALEHHGAIRRDEAGRYLLGPSLAALGRAATSRTPFLGFARTIATEIRDRSGESVQVFVPESDGRRCVVSLESPNGLRWIVPEGSLFPIDRGSAGKVLSGVRLKPGGWIESVEERVPGVASVSAPVIAPGGAIVAALSVSGPLERMGRQPGVKFGAMVVAGAQRLSAMLES